MSARIDTAEALTKAEKLARAMNNVMSGGRAFNRQLAAQVRDELRAQQREIARLTAALADAEDRGAAQMRERAAKAACQWWDDYDIRDLRDIIRAMPLREPGAAP